MAIPTDPQTLLTRAQLAGALTEAGFPVTVSSLSTRATRGGGPPYQHWGYRTVLYEWGPALEWARSRLGQVVTTTSELDAQDAA
jgi:hypothetical protein